MKTSRIAKWLIRWFAAHLVAVEADLFLYSKSSLESHTRSIRLYAQLLLDSYSIQTQLQIVVDAVDDRSLDSRRISRVPNEISVSLIKKLINTGNKGTLL